MAFKTEDWWRLAAATEWVAADLAGLMPDGMQVPDPATNPVPTSLKSLRHYLPLEVVGQLDLIASVKIADGSLKNLVAELAAQHLAAAALIVESPSDDVLRTIRSDLATVNAQLKDVEEFRAAAGLAGALAKVIGKGIDNG